MRDHLASAVAATEFSYYDMSMSERERKWNKQVLVEKLLLY